MSTSHTWCHVDIIHLSIYDIDWNIDWCITFQVNAQAGDHHHQNAQEKKDIEEQLRRGRDLHQYWTAEHYIYYVYIYIYIYQYIASQNHESQLLRWFWAGWRNSMKSNISWANASRPWHLRSVESCREKQLEAEKEQLRQEWHHDDTRLICLTSCKSDARVRKHIWTPSRVTRVNHRIIPTGSR